MHLYDKLVKCQKHHKSMLRDSEEFQFYVANRNLLNGLDIYKALINSLNEFDIIRANIVIRAIQNKKALDEAILYAFKGSKMKTEEVSDFVHERMVGLPYIQEGDLKIYVPIFNRSVNELYYRDFGKLLSKPYSTLIEDFSSSCIDCFEMYGFSLYDSLFSKYIVIRKTEKTLVLYHFDFSTIYFVDDQGRLEAKLALFDKYMHRPVKTHIMDRIGSVVDAYLNDDREGMYQALVNNNLISKKLIFKIKHEEFKFKRKLQRKADRA